MYFWALNNNLNYLEFIYKNIHLLLILVFINEIMKKVEAPSNLSNLVSYLFYYININYVCISLE